MTPDSFAARATAKLRSKSILRWASKEPESARVLPRAEKRIVLVVADRVAGQVEVSVETKGFSFESGSSIGPVGFRRISAFTQEVRGDKMSCCSIWEPWKVSVTFEKTIQSETLTTNPVPPTTAIGVEVMSFVCLKWESA